MHKKPVILGCRSLQLGADEVLAYKNLRPLGFIVFRRNCHDLSQLVKLTKSIRELLEDQTAPILVDQEGGRVIRLSPPHWPATAAFGEFGKLAKKDMPKAKELLKINCRAISGMLNEAGINVVASPCLDLQFSFTSRVIADRSFGSDVNLVKTLGQVAINEFLSNRIIPIIKHLPGHGRAVVDSHDQLPVVQTDLDLLKKSDFYPFYHVKNSPWAMLAHIKYTSLDKNNPLTFSQPAINFIKGYLKYKKLLITDSIYMQALSGSIAQRAQKAFYAGFDLVLSTPIKDEQFSLADNLAVLNIASDLSTELQKNICLPAPSYNTLDATGKNIDYVRDIDFVNRQLNN